MRSSCLMCGSKHVAEAEVLMKESLLGYPIHALLCLGHLSQAEDELLAEYPEIANMIRAERIKYQTGLSYNIVKSEKGEFLDLEAGYSINTVELLYEIVKKIIEKDQKETVEIKEPN